MAEGLSDWQKIHFDRSVRLVRRGRGVYTCDLKLAIGPGPATWLIQDCLFQGLPARPPGVGPNRRDTVLHDEFIVRPPLRRRLPARRLGPLCLALLCALPVSPRAVEDVVQNDREITSSRGRVGDLKSNDRLVVSPGVSITANIGDSFSIGNVAVSGCQSFGNCSATTNVGLDNKGRITAGNDAFVANSIFKVTNSGTISGSTGAFRSMARFYGIRANSGDITTLENKTSGIIVALFAVSATGHIGTLTNDNTISGISITGGRDSDGRLRGAFGAGVEANSIGTLTNRKVLRGTYRAILVSGNIKQLNNEKDGVISSIFGEAATIVYGSIDTLTNAGSILSNTLNSTNPANSALKGGAIGTLTNEATGTIKGKVAIEATAITTQLTNRGTIQGGTGEAAIHLTSTSIDSGILTNYKTIKGGAQGLLSVSPITKLSNEKGGLIEGGTGAGVDVQMVTTLNNRGGTITSTSSDGIKAGSIGTLNNSGSGKISGASMGSHGIAATSIGTLNNSGGGEISGAMSGVQADSIDTLRNKANSTIKGGAANMTGNIGVSVSGTLGLLENSGTLEGGAQGVKAGTITKLVNNKGGSIKGGEAGVEGETIVELVNNKDGMIEGDTHGVLATDRLGMLQNGGMISGAIAGITADKRLGTLTNLAGGTISGGQNGIAASAIDLLDNSGTIMGDSGAAVRVARPVGGGGAGLLGRLVNRAGGRITSTSADGVEAEVITTFENNGMITGAGGKSGLLAQRIGTLINQQNGQISGGLNGIQAAFVQTLSNHGTIRGATGAGLSLGSGGGGRLRNSGLITGGAGAHGIRARGAIDLLQNQGSGIIEGQTGVAINPTQAGETTIDNAGILRSLDGPPGVALVFGGQQGRDRLILRDNFSLEGNILWDGRNDTLQYRSPRPALLTFTDNDAPALTEPTRFDVDAGGRPWLRGTRRSARFGQAETIIAIFDPTLYRLGDAALSQWTGAIFQSLDRLPGPGAERPGPNRRHKTGPLDHVLWARPFGGLHRFKQDGPFVPPARHRFAGGLAGFSALGQRAGGGLFVGAAQSVIQVSGPARDEDSEHIFTGVWAGARIAEFDLDAAVLVGRGRYRSDWQRANNRAPGGAERVWSKYTGLFVSPELGLATRLEVKGVALRPSLRLRYLGLFASAHDYQTEVSPYAGQAGGGQTALRINDRELHIGLARASLGVPLFPYRSPPNAHGGQFDGEFRLGAEGRMRLGGDTVSALLGGQNAEFKVGGGKAITGFAGVSFDYAVPALNLTFSGDFEARYGSMADVGIHGQLGFMWEF